MVNKSKSLNIGKDKLIETYKIARYAESSRVMGNAELLFKEI